MVVEVVFSGLQQIVMCHRVSYHGVMEECGRMEWQYSEIPDSRQVQ